MRWRTLGLRKSRCIRENPVFPHVIYRKKAWIFETCLEQMLHNAGHWAVTLNISKKINWLLKWLNFSLRICFASSVAILLGFVIHWYPSVSATFAPVLPLIITFHILIVCSFWAILSDTTPRAKHLFNVYLLSCINKDYWLIATVDAKRWRKIATTKKKILVTQILCCSKLK